MLDLYRILIQFPTTRVHLILIEVIIICHQICLGHDLDLQVLLVLLLLLPLDLQGSQVILIVLITSHFLPNDSTILIKYILLKVHFLLLRMDLANRHILLIIYNHVQFLLFLRHIPCKEYVQSNLHILAIFNVYFFYYVFTMGAAEHLVDLKHVVFVLK